MACLNLREQIFLHRPGHMTMFERFMPDRLKTGGTDVWVFYPVAVDGR